MFVNVLILQWLYNNSFIQKKTRFQKRHVKQQILIDQQIY